MSELVLQRLTGMLGMGIFALTLVEILLYFVYSGPPPVRNVLTRIFIDLFVITGVIVWVVGFRGMIFQARPAYEWLGTCWWLGSCGSDACCPRFKPSVLGRKSAGSHIAGSGARILDNIFLAAFLPPSQLAGSA
jgi:hypothetical protein